MRVLLFLACYHSADTISNVHQGNDHHLYIFFLTEYFFEFFLDKKMCSVNFKSYY